MLRTPAKRFSWTRYRCCSIAALTAVRDDSLRVRRTRRLTQVTCVTLQIVHRQRPTGPQLEPVGNPFILTQPPLPANGLRANCPPLS